MAFMCMIIQGKILLVARPAATKCTVQWLISNLPIYLIGFWSRRNRPKAGKDSQKDGGGKYAGPTFTIGTLSIIGAYAKATLR